MSSVWGHPIRSGARGGRPVSRASRSPVLSPHDLSPMLLLLDASSAACREVLPLSERVARLMTRHCGSPMHWARCAGVDRRPCITSQVAGRLVYFFLVLRGDSSHHPLHQCIAFAVVCTAAQRSCARVRQRNMRVGRRSDLSRPVGQTACRPGRRICKQCLSRDIHDSSCR